MNQITINLLGIKNEEQLLYKLGEVFELGGPHGNITVSSSGNKGWGLNWNALNDSLKYLDTGGIWGISKKFEFPLKIIFENSQDLQKSNKEAFNILKEILDQKTKKDRKEGNRFSFEFR